MTKKERLFKQDNENCKFEIEQSKILKFIGYFILGIALINIIVIKPNFRIPKDGISQFSILLLVLLMILLMWIFLIVPYKIITTKKRIIVDNIKFEIESNKTKYAISTTFNKLIWWKKVSTIEAGDYLQLKFATKKVDLSNYEFKDLMKLEKLLKSKYNHKNKSSR
jgi:hypothetical protein